MEKQRWIIIFGITALFVSTTLSNQIFWFSRKQLHNCSCPVSPDYNCDKPFAQLEADCNCTSNNKTELNSNARIARQNDVVFWSNRNTKTSICCANASSTNEADMLRILLNSVFIRNLTFNHCHNLISNDRVTLFGLEDIIVYSTDTSAHPVQNVIIKRTDLTTTSTEYRDFHVVRMHLSVLTGNSPIRAWSIIRKTNNSSPLKNRGLDYRDDGRFMLTYIYA